MVMAGSLSEECVVVGGSSSVDGSSGVRHCRSVDSLGEWRSSEQVENGTPSTSPPHWDSDDDDDDSGPKPSDLYGKFTWKIENFSQISKRELRSNAFEVGRYKWYILIYPQGCDACNHLSLFLCVANHDKLLPGWSHFALFTIAVVNKDPKKNKYNDTLHRFWKKEHDWGWKKFMELEKVMDGFIDDDTLTIKAQVQVIREKAHRPFRCLDCQYRRELIRVYLAAVQQICVRFVDEKRQKLQSLIGDKTKWASFHAFWLGIDWNTRQHMSRDRTDAVLKVIVKHFFVEKEVASTLVMDSLYSGLRALESQSRVKKLRANLLEKEESPAPLIFIENDMFVLADDVFLLLERAALESVHLPLASKEEKGLPSRAKDMCCGDEVNTDSIPRDERRLTELGRRTLEIFVLAHIFSRIEIAYKEAVALKRQEELIREEEAEQAENEKREKRAKKKQARQRRNSHKGKDRKNEKPVDVIKEKNQLPDSLSDERTLDDFSPEHGHHVNEKSDLMRDVSDVSDPGDDGAEALHADVEDRDSNPLSWDNDTIESHPTAEACKDENSNGHAEKKSSSFVDDSSSTCSTDSVPSVVVNGPYKGNSSLNNKSRRYSNRGKIQSNKDIVSTSTANAVLCVAGSSSVTGPEPEGNLLSLKDQTQPHEQPPLEKVEAEMILGNSISIQGHSDEVIPSNSNISESEMVSSSVNHSRKTLPNKQSLEEHTTTRNEVVSTPEPTPKTPIQSEKSVCLLVKSPQNLFISKTQDLNFTPQAMTSTAPQAFSITRPSSAPVIASTKPSVPLASTSQPMPLLSRAFSSIGRLDSEPQSYRNATIGARTVAGATAAGFSPRSSLSSSTQSSTISQPSPSSSSSSSSHPPYIATRKDDSLLSSIIVRAGNVRAGIPESTHDPRQWSERSHNHVRSDLRIGSNAESHLASHQSQGVMLDEFPHLDIINDLLDEDRIIGRAALNGYRHHDDLRSMNQQYAFPGDLISANIDPLNNPSQFDIPDYYYDEISQMVYDSFVPLHGFGDVQPLHVDFSLYGNSMDALLQNQWPANNPDLSALNFGGAMDVNGYGYQLPEYSGCNLDGYNMMYQPANGL